MPPILDFSSAFPWLGAGFLAGLFLYWLVRLLLGIDRRRNDDLVFAQTALDDSRRNVAELSNKAASLESEWARLMTELGQLKPRAELVPQMEQQLSQMQQSIVARQQQVDAANQQIAALRESRTSEMTELRHDLETHLGTAKYYESEFNRLFAEHDAVNKNALSIANDLQRTKAGLEAATRDAGEAVRLRSELASTKADIAALRGELDQRKGSETSNADALAKLKADYEAKLKSAEAEAVARSAEARKHAEDIAQLKAKLSAVPPPADNIAEFTRLKDEMSGLTASLTAARSAEQAATAAKQAQQNEFLQARTSLEESSLLAAQRADEIARLKAQLAAMPGESENFRRFKDALDAANRIAAGLPEKS
jgi:chromosome segregation ATPase